MAFVDRLDRAILALFPRWGAERIAARRKLQVAEQIASRRVERFGRAWEAADNDRFRGSKWFASRLSANSAIEEDLETLRDRAKDLYRNDSYSHSAIEGRTKNVVGCGYRFQARIRASESIPEERAERLNEQIEAAWNHWSVAEKLPAKMRQFQRCKGIYGEAFLVLSDRGAADKPVPLAVQVIAPERVETPPEREGRPNVRLGIEFDPETKLPVAYFVRRSHPHDTRETDFTYDRIPAERVLHSFEAIFPGQIRGIPWLAPAMADLKDLKDFVEANLITEQIAACFSVFITKTRDPYQEAENSSDDTAADGQRLEEIEPGLVQYLGENEEVHFADPNRPGGSLAPFMEWRLRAVSAALDYPYELLAKDYKRTTYSAGRLSLIDGRIGFKCWQQADVSEGWTPVAHRFLDELVIVGEVDIEADEYRDSLAEFRRHVFITPGWPWVDPTKEVQADVDAIAAGLLSRTDANASRGLDDEEIQDARKRERIRDLEIEAEIAARRRELGLEETGAGTAEGEAEDRQEPEPMGAEN